MRKSSLTVSHLLIRLSLRRRFLAALAAALVAGAGVMSLNADSFRTTDQIVIEEFEESEEPAEAPVETPAAPVEAHAALVETSEAAAEISEATEPLGEVVVEEIIIEENPAPADADVADTAEVAPEEADTRSPFEKAVELYKSIRQLELDGMEEDMIYDTAYAAYQQASLAITADDIAEEDLDQLKGILMDLNNTMARAAVNYSSKGDSANMTRFARAYIDTQQLPQMSTAEFVRDPELYPALVYCAASGSYNAGDLEDAIKYFEIYLRTLDSKHREPVSLFYGQALMQTNQPTRGVQTVVDAANEFPTNFQLLTIAMQLCLDANRRDLLAPLVPRALTFKPNDEKFLNLQAQVYEDQQEYRPALDIYMQLDEMRPNSLGINESIARCYYNLGTSHYNESITASNDKDVSRSRRQSNAYFSSAAEKYEELAENDPNNEKYLRAMGSSYAVLGNKSKVDAVNVRLSALGGKPIAMNDLPVLMGDPKAAKAGAAGGRNIPSYQEYAQAYVTEEISKWAQKGEFEKVDDYTRRIAPENIRKEQKRLSAITEEKYLKEFAGHLMLSELKLRPYDVENETYAIDSDFGPVYIKVPLKNSEAELFKNTWEKVQISNAKYFVKDDRIAISTITFHTPNGKDYTYNADANLNYDYAVVKVDLDKLVAEAQKGNEPKGGVSPAAGGNNKSHVVTLESDVDKNIPQNKSVNDKTIALVIANEHYGKVPAVTSAEHDGDVFARYCRETLGIPANQVLLYKDATYGNILSAISQLKNSVKALGDDVDVIVYYAGHGVPDENTKDAYIMPVDADPMVMATAYPLKQLYDELGDMGAANVMVFMDACFSGANRGEGMLANARAVVLKANAAAPKGNMFVLSAADGNETALPWPEKNHGLFTYYLLKKLQDSKGNASLQELADYVSSEVKKISSLNLNKTQTPKMTVTGSLAEQIGKKKLRK